MLTPDALDRINRYCDTVPRATADAEEVGPFTLFVARTGWPFYARPSLGLPAGTEITADEVAEVLGRQRAIGVPLNLEWVHEATPSLLVAAQAYGLVVEQRPLLVLHQHLAPTTPKGVAVTVLDPDDRRFGAARGAVASGFAGTDALRAEPMQETIAQRAREGLLRVVGAFDTGGRAIGGGTLAARDGVVELTGIAVLPSWRGRGVGAAITATLAADAIADETTMVWLSATDDTVARIYERVGFTRIGSTCEAEHR